MRNYYIEKLDSLGQSARQNRDTIKTMVTLYKSMPNKLKKKGMILVAAIATIFRLEDEIIKKHTGVSWQTRHKYAKVVMEIVHLARKENKVDEGAR